MDAYKDFTYDPVRFPLDKVKELREDLSTHGQQLVMIVDPGIKIEPGYDAYGNTFV